MLLWDAATGALHAVLKGHTGDAYDVKFSPDGTTLASASADQTVRLWNVATGESRVLGGHTNEVSSVAFSPDGTMLASGSDNIVRLWDVATGESRVLEVHPAGVWVWYVTFSPDGSTLVASGEDGTIRLWDVATGAPVAVLQGYPLHVRMARPMFSSDGSLLVAGDFVGVIWLWDMITGAEPMFLRGHEDSVVAAFSPDGSLLLSGSGRIDRAEQIDASVRLWDVERGVQLRALDSYFHAVNAIAFNPDQTLIAASVDDGTIRLWRLPATP
jgi:WD40 repeat protein